MDEILSFVPAIFVNRCNKFISSLDSIDSISLFQLLRYSSIFLGSEMVTHEGGVGSLAVESFYSIGPPEFSYPGGGGP